MVKIYCNISTLTIEEAECLIDFFESKGRKLEFIINDGVISAIVTDN